MAEQLEKYKNKRDFAKTSEPSGERQSGVPADGKNKALRFVVQFHIASRVHYDFRLEWNGVLLSWAVPKGPSYNPRDKRLAVMVEDHPLEYANFEGLIPKGQYGGGTVQLWDDGTWAPQPQTDFQKGLEEGSLKIVLKGKRLKGKWALVRLKDQKDGENNWLLIKENDEFSLASEGISQYTTSVKSGRTTQEIEQEESFTRRKNPIRHPQVQLAKLAEDIPAGDDWLFEVKYDGYRILAFAEGGEIRLSSRNEHDYTDKFKSVTTALQKWTAGRAMILDGEVIVTDDSGKPDFQALQSYVKKPDGKRLSYIVFDVLALDGEDLRKLPLFERKERLEALLKGAPANISMSRHVVGKGRQMFEAAAEMQLEGIVGKKVDSLYSGDRNGDWIKLKCYKRQEFVVGGYTQSDKKTEGISALLLGVYEGDALVYSGRAGTGFSARVVQELQAAFVGLESQKTPFQTPPKAKTGEKFFWLKPQLIAEIQFAEFTADNTLRQASFKGLRDDKDPQDVVREYERTSVKSQAVRGKAEKELDAISDGKDEEQKNDGKKEVNTSAKASKKKETAKKTTQKQKQDEKEPRNAATAKTPKKKAGTENVVCGVTISSPDRIIFETPKITKMDVAEYYQNVADRMLRFAGGRVLSVVRCHNGVHGSCFFKKHPVHDSAGVKIIPVENSEGEKSDYFYIDDSTGLISQVQLGSLEFHIWGSRVETLEKPDVMVFDLDPDEGMGQEQIRRGVKDLKSVLDALQLKSFLKTSGGKGYHVVVPFKPTVGWDAFHDFAKGVAQLMKSKWHDLYTDNIRKVNRKGKIFIDWVRNGRGATSIAPYSLRARPGAKVSMPILWKELDTVAPDGIDMLAAVERLKQSDPWKEFFRVEQELKI